MKLDLQGQRERFIQMGFEEKREAVKGLLEWVKDGNALFTDLYRLIISEHAIEQDFYDIFDSLIIVLYREEKAEERMALDQLGDIKNRLQEQRAQEESDRTLGKNEAELLLVDMM